MLVHRFLGVGLPSNRTIGKEANWPGIETKRVRDNAVNRDNHPTGINRHRLGRAPGARPTFHKFTLSGNP